MTTPTDEEKALPSVDFEGYDAQPALVYTLPGEYDDEYAPMTVEHLSALLSALDPSTRARVLEPYQQKSPWADSDPRNGFLVYLRGWNSARLSAVHEDELDRLAVQLADAAGREVTMLQHELSAARAEVERLRARLAALTGVFHGAANEGHPGAFPKSECLCSFCKLTRALTGEEPEPKGPTT